jgi:hypothetical protein
MARLIYLVMVATLMTFAFVGYEWVATTSTTHRVGVYTPDHRAKMARQAIRAKLAAAAKDKLAAGLLPSNLGTTASISENDQRSKEDIARDRRTARVRPKHLRITSKRPNDFAAETSFGFGAPSFSSPVATLERGPPDWR